MNERQSVFFYIVLIVAGAILLFGYKFYIYEDKTEPVKSTMVEIVETPAFPTIDFATPPDILPKLTPFVDSEMYEYVEIIGSCGPYWSGECVNTRTGPGKEFPVATKLRNGIVLQVSESIEKDGMTWHKIKLDDWLLYPERVNGNWYVSGDYTRKFTSTGYEELDPDSYSVSTKKIIVDRGDQTLYAYEGDELFMETKISTGIWLSPTPRGTFTIFRKTPSRYMQGPLPGISNEYYDLVGVPWNMYFTKQGAAIHGAYWHDKFGQQRSHGCVNLPLDLAEKIYKWAELGTQVIVQD
jgi:hypothetical protein